MKTLTTPNISVLREVVQEINKHSKFKSKRSFLKVIEDIKFPECKVNDVLSYDNRNYHPIGNWLANKGYITVIKDSSRGIYAPHEVLILHRITDPITLDPSYNQTHYF